MVRQSDWQVQLHLSNKSAVNGVSKAGYITRLGLGGLD